MRFLGVGTTDAASPAFLRFSPSSHRLRGSWQKRLRSRTTHTIGQHFNFHHTPNHKLEEKNTIPRPEQRS